ncbi:stage III sporulation protein AE [Caldibacillus lycopersici]|uniref:Stage III sporulation protein AE n=1 Tax=Perspicuibacillus lycopersici TaxID=1325689 RepID=A0AAE3LQS9_9BACI|nr:stage III sporulation protein AE [Perspicuibacillus lycopersici]MCU9613839.1 stage III sporulation protein AE [Perspicuibacillus lycopersici]
MKRQIVRCILFGMVFFFLWTSPIFASTPEEGKNAIDLVEEQLETIDFSDIQQFWDQIVTDYGGFLPESEKGSLLDYIKSADDFSLKEWGLAALRYVFHELIANGQLLGSLIMLTIFSMFLQSIQNAFEKSTVSKIAYSIVFMVLMIIALNSFHIAIEYASGAIDNMIHFTIAFIPLLLALIATSGGIISGGFFHPVILFLTDISGIFVKNIVLPLLFLSTLLSIVSTLTEHYKATQLAQLLRNWSIGLLGVFMTVFLSVVSIQGATTAVADGVAIKTAKFVTGNFIPVVGRMLTDAADTVISASVLMKNTIGIAGVGILLLLIMFPALKILMIAFIFKFAAALLQPLGGGPIITCLDIISKSVIYLFAALGIVAIMFFLCLTVIVMAGNLTMMVR